VVATVAREEVDWRNLDHGVAARALAEHGARAADENLTCEGWVVDLHGEAEILVGRGARHAVADEVDAMADIVESLDARDLDDVCLVVGEVVVGLDGCGNVIEFITVFELDVDHAAVDARSEGDGHGERIFYALLALDADGMTHGATRAEIGVGETLGCHGLKDGAYHGVGTRIPASGDDGCRVVGLGNLVELVAEGGDEGVDVEAVDGRDALGEDGLGGIGHGARRGAEERGVDAAKLLDVGHDLDAR